MFEGITEQVKKHLPFFEIIDDMQLLTYGSESFEEERRVLEHMTLRLIRSGFIQMINRDFRLAMHDGDFVVYEGDNTISKIK